MTTSWRRFRERTRQSLHMSRDRYFKPTDNSRNIKMFNEATEFEHRLRTQRKSVKQLQKATIGMMENTRATLQAPLPQVFDRPYTGGKAQPIVNSPLEPQSFASAPQADDLSAIAQHTSRKMHQQVLTPMNQWLKTYDDTKTKMSILEKLRLDFDAERRLYNRFELRRVAQQQQKGSVNARTSQKLGAQELRLNDARTSWTQYEERMYEQLTQLIADARSLLNVMGTAMDLQEGAFSSAQQAAAAVDVPALPEIPSATATPVASAAPSVIGETAPVPISLSKYKEEYGPPTPMEQVSGSNMPQQQQPITPAQQPSTPAHSVSGASDSPLTEVATEAHVAKRADAGTTEVNRAAGTAADEVSTPTKGHMQELPSAPTHKYEQRQEYAPATPTQPAMRSQVAA